MHANDARPALSTPTEDSLEGDLRVDAQALRTALASVLASPLFARSPCMRRLLEFLVDAAVAGEAARLSEYRIGLEALGKNPRTYSPNEDPSVRVQVGRLRERLGRYYQNAGKNDPLRLEIPSGHYVPQLQRNRAAVPATAAAQTQQALLVSALQELAGGGEALQFAQGLREELVHRLFRELRGMTIVSPEPGMAPAVAPQALPATYRLEGSVRHVQGVARATLRLIEQRTDRLLWCDRFDHRDVGMLQAQEALSAAICAGLQRDVFASAAAPGGAACCGFSDNG